ncbi:MAG: hypothetical protein ACFFB3_11265 [Candidatus Hodarchaeota archaeon]
MKISRQNVEWIFARRNSPIIGDNSTFSPLTIRPRELPNGQGILVAIGLR